MTRLARAAVLLPFLLAACSPRDAEQAADTLEGTATPPPASPVKAPTLVRTGTFERGEIHTAIDVSTDIEAETRVHVFPKVGGSYIEQLAVREGDVVAVGDPLVILDDVDFDIALRRLNSERLQAEVSLRQARVQLAEAEAKERAQLAMFERARADYDRAKNAMTGDIDVLSVKEVTDVETAFDQAKAERDGAQLATQRAEAELELAQVVLEATEIAVESARNDLEQTVVRSPIDGIVEERLVNVGLLVSPQTHLLTLVDPKLLIANLRVPQEDMRAVSRIGLSVEFRLDALPGRIFHGHVEAINPSVDPSSGLIKVRARLDDEAVAHLRPGMFARARVIVESRPDAFLLHKRAVVHEDGESWFFTVEDGVARRHSFEPGATTENQVEVVTIDGVPPDALPPAEAAGLAVIMVGQDRLRDGDPVEVVGESS